jgi:hypothetical protein
MFNEQWSMNTLQNCRIAKFSNFQIVILLADYNINRVLLFIVKRIQLICIVFKYPDSR